MEIAGAESEFINATARRWLESVCRSRGDEAQIKNEKWRVKTKPETPGVVSCNFDGLHIAVQRKILQSQLLELGVVADFELVEQLRESGEKLASVGLELAVARDAAGKV